MSLRNSAIAELNVPRDKRTPVRIIGFYRALGWEDIRVDTTDDNFWYVGPYKDRTPTIAYWETDNPDKIGVFEDNPSVTPSKHSRGLHLPPAAMKAVVLMEQSLVVPSDTHVAELWQQGGDILEAHATQELREHSGAQEFRFTDPFGFALRVTADPGYQLPGQR